MGHFQQIIGGLFHCGMVELTRFVILSLSKGGHHIGMGLFCHICFQIIGFVVNQIPPGFRRLLSPFDSPGGTPWAQGRAVFRLLT